VSGRTFAGRAAGEDGLPVIQTHSIRRKFLGPFERFIRIEASSGIVLLCATAVALSWANSPWHDSYESLGRLHFVVNDGLMTLFFLLIGLEIRREMQAGSFASVRAATVPLIAALGGMIMPALIFLAIADASLRRGWAIPTATDIAFAVGALALVGGRAPPQARVLLLALAVMDDIGAILIIAFFFSSGIGTSGLLIAASGAAAALALRKCRIQASIAYLLAGLLIWFGLYRAGVHPTLAGVVIGLLTPTPRLEEALHPWVAYGIMPLFALINAGVALDAVQFHGTLMAAIVIALALGKPLGISLFVWLAARTGTGTLAPGLHGRGVLLVGCLGGIGFTMSVFLATLAFQDPRQLAAAKAAVLLGSLLAGLSAFILGRLAWGAGALSGGKTN
jgi:NhaA family Na+:H+ antiporter